MKKFILPKIVALSVITFIFNSIGAAVVLFAIDDQDYLIAMRDYGIPTQAKVLGRHSHASGRGSSTYTISLSYLVLPHENSVHNPTYILTECLTDYGHFRSISSGEGISIIYNRDNPYDTICDFENIKTKADRQLFPYTNVIINLIPLFISYIFSMYIFDKYYRAKGWA